MKTSNKPNIAFRLITILFMLCFIITEAFRAYRIKDSVFKRYNYVGTWFLTASTIVYTIGIILGIAFLIMYFLLFRKVKIRYGILYLPLVVIMLPFLIYGSLDYYKDIYKGKVVFETNIYDLYVESYYEEHPEIPKEILLSSYIFDGIGLNNLAISDEMYFDLIQNNPNDLTQKVFNPVFAENVYPHIHNIKIVFYENTRIVESIEIIYND